MRASPATGASAPKNLQEGACKICVEVTQDLKQHPGALGIQANYGVAPCLSHQILREEHACASGCCFYLDCHPKTASYCSGKLT